MAKDRKDTAIYVAYEDHEPLDESASERNLMSAILMNAMIELNHNGEAGRRAREYFLSKEDDYLFSFRSICNYLSIDPNTILIVSGLKTVAGRTPPPKKKKNTRQTAKNRQV